MNIQHNVSLRAFNTLGLDVKTAAFYRWDDMAMLPSLLNAAAAYPNVLWLGSGSNIVLTRDFDGLTVHIATRGIRHTACGDDAIRVTAAAGEIWHDFVDETLHSGWYGLENLSLIPGTVGAAPIQNIGAYGVEAGEFIHRVFGVDTLSRQPFTLTRAQCRFAYRDSIFKHDDGRQLLVTAVEFELPTSFHPRTAYGDVAARAAQLAQGAPLSARHIAAAVCAIRREKLPDPRNIGNVGSFFHNPIIHPRLASGLLRHHPHMPHYPQTDGRVKLAAGWLIEQAGLKGATMGGMAVHDKQALVLVNRGGATPQDVLNLTKHIQATVWANFGVRLTPEPRFVE